ncbi:hypothetical protein HN51_055067, partial [Arachis hypogaea]
VPIANQPKFCGRKEWPTQNVLAKYGFDMRFTYALGRWESTASDSKFLRVHYQGMIGSNSKRFTIIASGTEPYYDVEVMLLIAQVDPELQNNNPKATYEKREEVSEDYKRGAALRDNIAAQ